VTFISQDAHGRVIESYFGFSQVLWIHFDDGCHNLEKKSSESRTKAFRSLKAGICVITSILLFVAFCVFELPLLPSPLSELVRRENIIQIVFVVSSMDFASVAYSRLRNSPGYDFVDVNLCVSFLLLFLSEFLRRKNVDFEITRVIECIPTIGGYHAHLSRDVFTARIFS
jgi:hypothetical protein